MAYFLLHNFIRGEMLNDPIKQHVDAATQDLDVEDGAAIPYYVDLRSGMMRDDLANSMWNNVCFTDLTPYFIRLFGYQYDHNVFSFF